MPGASNYVMDKLLNWAFRDTGPGTPPAATYCRCYNGDPDAGGTVAPGLPSVLVETDRATSPFWNAPENNAVSTSGRRVRNSAAINFGAATADAGLVNFMAVMDGADPATANRLFVASLTTPRTVLTGDTFQVPTQGAELRLSRT